MIQTGFGRNYVINLKRHPNRLKQAIEVLGDSNTTVIEAIDGKDYYDNKEWLKENMAETVIDPNGLWTVSIVACSLSHKKAWQAFLDSGEPTACFFEDDVITSPRFDPDIIEEIRDGVDDKNWGCIFLGKYNEEINLVDEQSKYLPIRNKDVNWGMYRRFKRHQWAAHAYVLNRKSAQWYVDKMEKVNKAADVFLEWTPFDIYAPKYSQFYQRKTFEKLGGDYLPFKHLVEDPENAISHTMDDLEQTTVSNLGIGKTLVLKDYSLGSWKMGPARASFKGYKLTFDL